MRSCHRDERVYVESAAPLGVLMAARYIKNPTINRNVQIWERWPVLVDLLLRCAADREPSVCPSIPTLIQGSPGKTTLTTRHYEGFQG